MNIDILNVSILTTVWSVVLGYLIWRNTKMRDFKNAVNAPNPFAKKPKPTYARLCIPHSLDRKKKALCAIVPIDECDECVKNNVVPLTNVKSR